jgi:hypothetical protein
MQQQETQLSIGLLNKVLSVEERELLMITLYKTFHFKVKATKRLLLKAVIFKLPTAKEQTL